MIIFVILYDGSQNFTTKKVERRASLGRKETKSHGRFRAEDYVSLTSEEIGMKKSPLYL